YYPSVSELSATSGSAIYAAANEHWTTRASRPGQPIPFYGLKGAPTGTSSTRLTLPLNQARSEALNRLCMQDGFLSLSPDTSRFVVFAVLLLSWLHRVSCRFALGFDAPVAGRPTPASKRAIGLFIEMFPFDVTIGPSDTFRTLARASLDEAYRFLCHALPGMSAPSRASSSNVVLNFFPDTFG